MKVEWLLSELDEHIRTYTDLRAELSKLPSDGGAYKETERDLHKQLRRLVAEAQNTLEAIEESEN